MTANLWISIITPSLNQGQFIEETINSVISQRYPDLEYMVMDGGSRDGTLEIIKKYESFISYWASEPDNGQSHAINKALRRASGDILTWLNSDDLLLPHSLQRISCYFQRNPEVQFIHGNTIFFGSIRRERIHGTDSRELKVRHLAGMPFSQPASFFRRAVIEELGLLDENLHYVMDYDLLVRTALNFEILKVDDVFAKNRVHPDCKMVTRSTRLAPELCRVFSKVLRSFTFTNHLIEAMKMLSLYVEGQDSYRVSRHFSKTEIDRAFLHFLNSQIFYDYENLLLDKVRQLCAFVKDLDGAFYREYGLEHTEFRSRYLGKSVISLLRKFSR